jgi:serine/threonine protein kinase
MTSAPETSDDLPASFGPWLVLSHLGDGGQANAYTVVHQEDKQKTTKVLKAMKVWTPNSKSGSEAEQRGRFLQEVNALRGLATAGCPDIVSVLDADVLLSAGQPWYVMPLYGGPMSILREKYKGNVDSVLIVAETIASTLAWMHEHEPVHTHRDVHTGNIFFDPATERAKLGDFGLVHVRSEKRGITSGPLEEFGPWQWRPPELYKGSSNKHDPSSDIYLLGGVIYESLTGGEIIEETEQDSRFVHESPELTVARFSGDPRVPCVNALLRYMLARDPGARLSAKKIAELCSQVRHWRPPEPSPLLAIPSIDQVQAAAARLRSRSEPVRRIARQKQLVEVCSRAVSRFPQLTSSPAPFKPYQSLGIDSATHSRQLEDLAVTAIHINLKVGFGPEPKIALLSYIELASVGDMKWHVALMKYNNGEFEQIGSFLEGDPAAEALLSTTIASELEDLNQRLAAMLDCA